MEIYDENMLVRDALPVLFKRFGIPENPYTATHFVIRIGKFGLRLPNIPARVKVARFHDIHHIATGYPATWRGEAEIGAWELATGCRTSFISWFLNGGAVAVGLFLYPRAVIRAFIRGRRTRTNLYYDVEYAPLLNLTVKAVREKIGLPDEPAA